MAGRPVEPAARKAINISLAADVYERLELYRTRKQITITGRTMIVQEAAAIFLKNPPAPAPLMDAEGEHRNTPRKVVSVTLPLTMLERLDDLGRRRRLFSGHRSMLLQESLIAFLAVAPELAIVASTFALPVEPPPAPSAEPLPPPPDGTNGPCPI